jgi:hypothetical protein
MTERDEAVLRTMAGERRQCTANARRDVSPYRFDDDVIDRWDEQSAAIDAALAALDEARRERDEARAECERLARYTIAMKTAAIDAARLLSEDPSAFWRLISVS